ncbi:MAG: hypothetical protein HW421_2283 [Ignavibacteria bacterium]|nr:hypothetical protein [Ignavibacteria bacterium]
MIKSINIKNFKSLRDVEIKLEQVNLLIGANNCGKSNFLKALEFFGNSFEEESNVLKRKGKEFSFKEDDKIDTHNKSINLVIDTEKTLEFIHLFFQINYNEHDSIPTFYFFDGLNDNPKLQSIEVLNQKFLSKNNENNFVLINNDWDNNYLDDFIRTLQSYSNIGEIIGDRGVTVLKKDKFQIFHTSTPQDILSYLVRKECDIPTELLNIKIYKPNTFELQKPLPILPNKDSINHDASNLVSFFDNVKDNQPDIIDAIEKDLNNCNSDFKNVILKLVDVPDSKTSHKIIGLRDIRKNNFYGDELSDGTLYLISLLAIIHQKNPPKLILLEEPESNIHPRRINDVINMIIKMAFEKNIQVIMTTHSPLVLDQFKDMPEAVSIFEMKDGETKVKNLKDVIDESNKKLKKKKIEEINFSDSFGDYWYMGYFGGIPHDND